MSTTTEQEYHFHYITTNEDYKHDPLDSESHIRTLLLHPRNIAFDDAAEEPLTATFFEENVTGARYRVLCPIPDTQGATRTIDTPEGSLSITPALHSALSVLRRMATSNLSLWVPDLCIDPTAADEKKSRSRRMKMIYSSAEEVIVFLGKDDEDTGDAHELLAKIARLPISSVPQDAEDWKKAGLPYPSDSSWAALDRFICRPWFRSIEALPACVWAKNLRFVGTGWSLPADIFVTAFIKAWFTPIPMFGRGFWKEEMERGALCFSFFSRMRIICQHTSARCGFVELWRQCCAAEASSPAEKLAILLRISVHGDSEALWEIDDGLDESEQVLRIFRFLFGETREAVELLSEARGSAGSTDMPSWMPDLSTTYPRRQNLTRHDFRTAVVEDIHIPFTIDGDKRLEAYCAPLPCACTGHNVIVATAELPSEATRRTESSSIMSVLLRWQHAQGMLSVAKNQNGAPFTHYPDSGQRALEALWEIFSKGERDEPMPAPLAQSMASAKAIFMALSREDMQTVMREHFEQSRAAMEHLADGLEGWKFCVMFTGYMGLVPLESQEGDVVMAVLGARVPFVFRPVESSREFRVVGECYIHGVMYGEKMSKGFNGTITVLV
ncbi:hypothetical protein FALCPG4_014985 [Fusarium falciforme]